MLFHPQDPTTSWARPKDFLFTFEMTAATPPAKDWLLEEWASGLQGCQEHLGKGPGTAKGTGQFTMIHCESLNITLVRLVRFILPDFGTDKRQLAQKPWAEPLVLHFLIYKEARIERNFQRMEGKTLKHESNFSCTIFDILLTDDQVKCWEDPGHCANSLSERSASCPLCRRVRISVAESSDSRMVLGTRKGHMHFLGSPFSININKP